MAEKIVIDPITRIEGHAKVTLYVGQDGKVNDAQLHITQMRGFEKFCEGRPFHEMPAITARICGICPVAHLMASSKACDALLAVRVPDAGQRVRRLINMAQIVQSHALSFFHLSSPDLLLGMDADPAVRNVFGVMATHKDVARDGIRLRQFGQQAIEWLAGQRVHARWIVPGGVSHPVTPEVRTRILDGLPEAMGIAQRALALLKELVRRHQEEVETFGNFPSLYLGLVGEGGALEFYDGGLRILDSDGSLAADGVAAADYADYVDEAVEPWTYLKFPYYKPRGYPEGLYRVGPLARLNLADRISTPLAEAERQAFRALSDGPVSSSFHYHYARLIEALHCLEGIQELLNHPDVCDPHVRAHAEPNAREGVGISEAPRGTLIHHYRADLNGIMESANLIIATGHNNLAMNRSILQVARHFVKPDRLSEGMLNRVEAVIRAYDPCLSCSTHALGQMPMLVQLVGPGGEVRDQVRRD
ncbi:MAG: Ni/Fe hydrogenase subunit alpha [Candidatus Brocadiaceae bacterium]|nr:Ni/Fe hydrogenase subunit alpha [Candidatus Brocadiaceae bacterium]